MASKHLQIGWPKSLRPYQRQGIEAILDAGGKFILADQAGFGKTAQAIVSAQAAGLRRILVVAPASVLYNWVDEFAKWSDIKDVTVLTAAELPGPLDRIVVTQWDTLHLKVQALTRHKFQLLIADEAHRAKNPSALRTKALRAIARTIPHKLFLSATPFLNKRLELWPLLNMIDPVKWAGLNVFKREYCNDDKGSETWHVQTPAELRQHQAINAQKNREKLAKAIGGVFIRRTEDDVPMQLPGIQVQPVPVVMNPRWTTEYRAAKKDLILYLRTKGLPSRGAEYAEALVKIGYLRRIAGRAKIEAAIDLAHDILDADETTKVVLYAQHKDVVAALEVGLTSYGVIIIDGSVPAKRRHELIQGFQAETGPRVAVITEAGEEGINLFRANQLIMVERGWTPKSDDQVMGRLNRIGQTHFVTVHKLIAQNSIDIHIDNLIASKRAEFDGVVDSVPRNMVRALAEEIMEEDDVTVSA